MNRLWKPLAVVLGVLCTILGTIVFLDDRLDRVVVIVVDPADAGSSVTARDEPAPRAPDQRSVAPGETRGATHAEVQFEDGGLARGAETLDAGQGGPQAHDDRAVVEPDVTRAMGGAGPAPWLLPTAGPQPRSLKVCVQTSRESPWGVVLRTWARAVKEQTSGEVALEFYWNGTQGDEGPCLAKMRGGELDGALFSAVGLGLVDPNVKVLQVPGLYADWKDLDKVRDVLRPRFEKTFDDAGYVLVGWGDVGLDHLMSKGFPVKSPADLNGRRAWVWREDQVLPAVFEAAGAVPVPTSTFEAITELSTGRVTVVSVSALAAAELQWSSRLDHVTALVVAPSVGGLVLSKARLDALTPEQRAIVVDTGRVASKTLCDRMRKEDADALARLKKRMTYVEATPAELQAWEALFTDARARLTKGPLSPALVKEVEGLLAR